MSFKEIITPDGKTYQIPKDLELIFPISNEVPQEDLHFLAYIPWDDKYLESVPEEYRDFFIKVLPRLSKRTTDVHTAKCLGFLYELVGEKDVSKKVLAYSLILHDVGWDLLSDSEIARSLGVLGVLELSDESLGPKIKHAVEGEKIAKEMLEELSFSDEEKDLILQGVRLHDTPREIKLDGETPLEVQLLADLDHFWSFTHENFWQDTVRKGVDPDTYLKNLGNDLEGYFITMDGKKMARKLLEERRQELASLKK